MAGGDFTFQEGDFPLLPSFQQNPSSLKPFSKPDQPCSDQLTVGAFQIPVHNHTVAHSIKVMSQPTANSRQSIDSDLVNGSPDPKPQPISKIAKAFMGDLVLRPHHKINGIPCVSFQVQKKSHLLAKIKFLIIAKFSHGRPKFLDFESFLLSRRFKGSYKISEFDLKHVLVEFDVFEDFVSIWLLKSTLIKGYRVRFFQWKPDFHPSVESFIAPVWVHLPALPLYLFDEETILSIASLFGDLLYIDPANLEKKKVGHLSFCVAKDVRISGFDGFWIEFVGDSLYVERFWQRAVFSSVPDFCVNCHHIGHVSKLCKATRNQNGDKDEVDLEDTSFPKVSVMARQSREGVDVPISTIFARLQGLEFDSAKVGHGIQEDMVQDISSEMIKQVEFDDNVIGKMLTTFETAVPDHSEALPGYSPRSIAAINTVEEGEILGDREGNLIPSDELGNHSNAVQLHRDDGIAEVAAPDELSSQQKQDKAHAPVKVLELRTKPAAMAVQQKQDKDLTPVQVRGQFKEPDYDTFMVEAGSSEGEELQTEPAAMTVPAVSADLGDIHCSFGSAVQIGAQKHSTAAQTSTMPTATDSVPKGALLKPNTKTNNPSPTPSSAASCPASHEISRVLYSNTAPTADSTAWSGCKEIQGGAQQTPNTRRNSKQKKETKNKANKQVSEIPKKPDFWLARKRQDDSIHSLATHRGYYNDCDFDRLEFSGIEQSFGNYHKDPYEDDSPIEDEAYELEEYRLNKVTISPLARSTKKNKKLKNLYASD